MACNFYANNVLDANSILILLRGSSYLTACSDAPIYLFSSSGPLTDINLKEQAAAAAPTIWVFPQPGGPYKRTFDLNLRGDWAKIPGNFDGNSTICHCKR